MKTKLITLLSLFLLTSGSLRSQNNQCATLSKTLLNDLCIYVDGRITDDDENSPYDYKFEGTLAQLAGISITDSPQTVLLKFKTFWNKYKNCLTCDRTNFMLSEGNVIFYAAQNSFHSFFFILITRYKADINFIDEKHKMTVLDFIKKEMERILKNKPEDLNGKAFENTYKYLRKMGALHSSELKQN